MIDDKPEPAPESHHLISLKARAYDLTMIHHQVQKEITDVNKQIESLTEELVRQKQSETAQEPQDDTTL